MDAQQLVNTIAELRPEYAPAEQLRFALLVSLQHPNFDPALDRDDIDRHCSDLACQLSATSDQHAAVSNELDSLAATAPCEFTPDHLWSLVRALKIQSQILNLYLRPAE